jgi:hypothetical protein
MSNGRALRLLPHHDDVSARLPAGMLAPAIAKPVTQRTGPPRIRTPSLQGCSRFPEALIWPTSVLLRGGLDTWRLKGAEPSH